MTIASRTAIALVPLAALAGVSAAGAATPVFGSVAGKVTATKGTTFTLTSQTGSSVIVTRKTTVFTQNGVGARSDVKAGLCANAFGQKAKQGAPTALVLNLSPAVDGECPANQRRPGNGQRPPDGQQPPTENGGPGGGFGFDPENVVAGGGRITGVKGTRVTMKGQEGTVSFTVSKTTRIIKTTRLTRAAVRNGSCALVRGTTTDNGKTVTAQDVMLSQSVDGACLRPGPSSRPPASVRTS